MNPVTFPAPAPPTSNRLYSLDALRGFDMFWIIGGEEIFHSIAKVTGSPFWQMLSDQFEHPAWNGYHFYDQIFPMFLFIAGVATPYSVGRQLEKGVPRNKLVLQVVRRALILIILGIIKNNGLRLHPLSEIRFPSVLGRIGLAYMLANIIYLYTEKRAQIIWCISILIGYWLLLLFNSAPGFPHGDLTMQGNFASYIDRCIIPGKLYLGIHDPEGLVSTLPAISTGLMGVLTGRLLKDSPLTPTAKSVRMALTGAVFIIMALLWNLVFPINKNLWTSSFVMLTSGISLLLLSTFYYIIDIQGYRKWAFFFTVIGMNSILIYMSSTVIDWKYATNGLFQWLGQWVGDPWGLVVMVFCYLATRWALLYFLYKKKVFLRV